MADVNGRIEPDYAKMDREWRDSMRRVLTEAQCAKLTWAIWNYYLDKEEPNLPKPAMLVFETMRDRLDYRHQKSIEQLVLNRGGGTPSISEESQERCEVPDEDLAETCEVFDRNLEDESPSTCEHDESTSQWQGGQRDVYSHSQNKTLTKTSLGPGLGSGFDESERTRTPTLGEVRAYCEACGLVVSPEKFFNSFEANGWRDRDGHPIRDWRAVLRAWNKKEGRYPEKAQAVDAGNSGGGRKRLKISCVTSTHGNDKNEGMWFIHEPSEHYGLIPGSKGVSRDEAIRLAIELHPDLSDVAGK